MTLELKNVTKRVGADVHIHETNLVLAEGSFNILLGTTLAGKTTLMQLMAGLDQPTTGEVWFRGKNVTGVPVQKRNVVDGLPAVHQLSEFHRLREHRLAACASPALPRAEIDRRVAVGRRAPAPDADARAPPAASCPAASSSAPPSPARWSRIPTSSCSTSRSPISTTSCARSCATSCRSCSPAATASSSMRRPSRPRRCCSAATPRRCMKAASPSSGPTAEIYRRPRDLISAQVFSDPPINTAAVIKRGDEIVTRRRHPAGLPERPATSMPDGAYTIGIRPHHITPACAAAGSGRDRGPRAGHRAQRLGKRRPFRPRTARPGCRSRTASIPSRSARRRQALRRCRSQLSSSTTSRRLSKGRS